MLNFVSRVIKKQSWVCLSLLSVTANLPWWPSPRSVPALLSDLYCGVVIMKTNGMDCLLYRIHWLHRGANVHCVDRNDWKDRDATYWRGVSVWINRTQVLKVMMHKTLISCFTLDKLVTCSIVVVHGHIHSVSSINGSDGKNSSVKSTAGSEGSCCLATVDFKSFKITWNQEIIHNRELWKAQAAKGGHADSLLSFNQTWVNSVPGNTTHHLKFLITDAQIAFSS